MAELLYGGSDLCRVKLETLVEKLGSSLKSIKQLLDDAEIKQYQSREVKKWLGDVKHAMYQGDQLLDEIATDEALRKSQLSTSSINIFSPLPNTPFKSRIKELLERLGSLARQTHALGLKRRTCASNKVEHGPKPSEKLPTTSLVDESDIYVREGEKEKIINLLLDSDIGTKENDYKGIVDSLLYDDEENASDNQGPAVICIVGLGGMGKTTLAQLVYNDPRIKKQFELKAWVYVSETFDVIALTKAILEKFGFPADNRDLDLLQHQLKQELRRKKYLLVLDDVSDANFKHLEELLLPFKNGSFGSKIVVTTRSKEVARSIDLEPKTIHHLEPLDESSCWKLFERHAFHGRSVSEYPRLESIGKSLVDKCRGLPLAVKTLGKLLRKKFSPYEWEKILDSDLWHVWERDINYNPILRLGYHNLHANLKRCFAYCSIFPKGYRFKKDQLIKLWMADGLLCDTDKKEEEVGSKFFDYLESISFFQESPTEWASDRLPFVMHDLVNDLANLVAGKFCLQIEIDKVQDITEKTRHISCFLEGDGRELSLDHFSKIAEALRSLMVQPKDQPRESYNRMMFCNYTIVQHDLFSRLKYLRMLSLFGCNLQELADEISNLKLLRYLDMSYTGIKKLPESICMLYNLQTLILQYCELTELPSDFYKLINLRHLDLLGNYIKKMSKQIGSLHHLRTLTNFVVGEQSGCDIKELAKLNNLEGKLCISGLENVIDPTDAAEASLKDKKYLEILEMTYKHDSDNGEMDESIIEREVSVLEALEPNSNLNSLTIEHYQGSRFPNWLGDFQFSNLESLKLLGCKFCLLLPSLGQLPFLKELEIFHNNGTEIIGEEFYLNNSSANDAPFRSLELLRFHDMSEWKKWFCGEGCFPMLKELYIQYCPKLKMDLPLHLPSLKKLKIINCGELEASIPKAKNLTHLNLDGCKKILLNEFPSSLIEVRLLDIRFLLFSSPSTSLQLNIFNCAFLEELWLDASAFVGCSSSPLDLHCCPSLRRLSITGWCYSSFPFIGLSTNTTNLHYLSLSDCPQLELFPTGGLPSNLSWLVIRDCPKLIASREDLGFPSSLIQLIITNCPKLIASREEWCLFKLNSLERLVIYDEFENVESFPEENLLPLTLETLCLSGCSKLKIINYKGLLHLKSLKELSILDCPFLERLPEEGLPNSLSELDVRGCSLQLKQMYEKKTGERWHKISHIPYVSIVEKRQ